jgi:multidrug efflux pump
MRLYRSALVGAMRARWLTILVTIGLFGAALVGTRLVPQQFFPSSDRPELVVDLTLPHNASIYAGEAVAERFDGVLSGDQDVDHWSTYVGRGAIRFYLPLDVQLQNDFFAQAVIVAKDVAARERLQKRLEQAKAGQPVPLALTAPLRSACRSGAPFWRPTAPANHHLEPASARNVLANRRLWTGTRLAAIAGADVALHQLRAQEQSWSQIEAARTAS